MKLSERTRRIVDELRSHSRELLEHEVIEAELRAALQEFREWAMKEIWQHQILPPYPPGFTEQCMGRNKAVREIVETIRNMPVEEE